MSAFNLAASLSFSKAPCVSFSLNKQWASRCQAPAIFGSSFNQALSCFRASAQSPRASAVDAKPP